MFPRMASTSSTSFAEDVRAGLTRAGQKSLPSKYFYDDVGSALFEVISLLPEYGLTRADQRILWRHATAIVGRISSPLLVAELGSGSGRKTRAILEAVAAREATTYFPIEISPSALARCERELSHLASVRIVGLEREYLDGLREVAAQRGGDSRLLVLFLGSSIGNFERRAAEHLLREVRTTLQPGDALLLGTDLVKPVAQLMAAYDDPLGVTAAFNLNLLARINRELDGEFELHRFEHVVRYNPDPCRIEMHLRSCTRQAVRIAKAGVVITLEEGETIWTESSHKYQPDDAILMGRRTGFRCAGQWLDEEWPFAESLLIAE
jgi:L-histidine N-alpha-methyltransferase